MLNNEAASADLVALLAPQSAANTAAATSSWVDISSYEGAVVFVVATGIVTSGSITWTVEDADDESGTNAAAFTPVNGGDFTVVTTANDPRTQKRSHPMNQLRSWVRVVGTIVTGPVLVSASLLARPKYT